MPFRSRITSKGQVTVPVEVRRKLGLRHGDQVEFREHAGETIITRAPQAENPFEKYRGILARKLKHPFDSRKWQAELRDEE